VVLKEATDMMHSEGSNSPSQRDRLLLVGDDPERRHNLKETLESCGFEVTEAAPGPEAERKKDEMGMNGIVVDPHVPDMPLAEVERRYILRVLEKEGGHVARAARKLGIPRSSLYQRLKNYGVNLARRGVGTNGGARNGTTNEESEGS
jgi:DNA-binding NtrC family response regulator